jgi:hypothetical protein
MDDTFRVQFEQLSEAEKNNLLMAGLSAAERRDLVKELSTGKITKSFSKMTVTDITRPDGLNMNLQNVYPERIEELTTLHLPSYIDTPSPSAWLCKGLKMYNSVWAFNNEMVL